MVGLVLDASLAIDFVIGDTHEMARARSAISRTETEGAAVPSMWATEIANALLKRVRRRQLTDADAQLALGTLAELPISVFDNDPAYVWAKVFALARLRQVSAYDASYIELAASLRLPLATSDSGMRQAALASGISLLD